MDMDDLKEKYKGVPVWGRCLVAVVLGSLPGLYVYTEQGEGLDQQLNETEDRVRAAEADLETKMGQKARIPKLEQELAFTEDQLEKAKKSLPDKFDIDDLLQKVASIAREVGVVLSDFTPADEQEKSEGEVRFVQLPVSIGMTGKFHQVATYLDRLAHLETAIFVENLTLARNFADKEVANTPVARGATAGGENSHESNKAKRKDMSMSATYTMVLYRGANDSDGDPLANEKLRQDELQKQARLPIEEGVSKL